VKTDRIACGDLSHGKIVSHNNCVDWILAEVALVTQNLADRFPIGCARLQLNDNDIPLLILGCNIDEL
jgi:hypothetical protein